MSLLENKPKYKVQLNDEIKYKLVGILFVTALLDDYDKDIITNNCNPYTDDIYMDINNEKILIPKELQNIAIANWKEMNAEEEIIEFSMLFQCISCLLVILVIMFGINLICRN